MNVFGIDAAGRSDEEVGLEGIEALRRFWDSIGAPKSLGDYDIDNSEIGSMADKAVRFGPFGNFRKLQREDVVEIYTMAL
ncbi:NADH-dependent butanol dehydrogenase A [compost metagenome]